MADNSLLQAAKAAAEQVEAQRNTQPKYGTINYEPTDSNPLTTPVANTVGLLQKLPQMAQEQAKRTNNLMGYSSALDLKWLPGVSGRLTPTYIKSEYTDMPVEVYDTKTGKVAKTYNNILDYQNAALVVKGGAESPARLTWGDWASGMLNKAALGAGFGSSLAGGLKSPTGVALAAIGGAIGAGLGAVDLLGIQNNLYDAFDQDSARQMSLLAKEKVGANGEVTYDIDWDEIGGANSLSGALTRSYKTVPTDTPVAWNADGTGLNITVAPAFADSDIYKEYIKDVAASLKGLTKDTDPDGQYLKTLNAAITGLQNRYFLDAEEAARLQARYPLASEDTITNSIDTLLTGYADNDSELEAPVYIWKDGEIQESTAKALFNELYDMGGDLKKKDEFMGQLYGALADPALADDVKVIVDGELNAIRIANANSKLKYKGMITKGAAEYAGENAILDGLSINDLAYLVTFGTATGSLEYLEDDETLQSAFQLGSAVVNMVTTLFTMQKIENVNRRVLAKISDKIGEYSFKVLSPVRAAKLFRATATFSHALRTPGIGSTIAVRTYSDVAKKFLAGGLELTMNAVADLEFDLAKKGISELTHKEMDFWNEFSQDLAMDLVFTMASSGLGATALKQAGMVDFDVSDISQAIRENGKVTVDSAKKTKTIKFSLGEGKDYEVKVETEKRKGKMKPANSEVEGLTLKELGDALAKSYYEVNYESQKHAAEVITKLTDPSRHPIISKVYNALADDSLAIRRLGYQKLAETGDYTNLVKASNIANSGNVYRQVQGELLSGAANKAYQDLNKAVDNYHTATGNAKLTEAHADYMNASQALLRAQQDYAKNSAEYKRAKAIYDSSLEGVGEEEAAALRQLMDSLATLNKQIAAFEHSEGLQTTNFYKQIQKYNGYIPLFAKRDGTGRPVEYRNTHRRSDDNNVKLAPSAYQDPITATMQYMDAVVRNAARARQVKAIIELANDVEGIKVTRKSKREQDYAELSAEQLMEKYHIPESAVKAIDKIADTTTSWHKEATQIIEKNLFRQHVEDYAKARAKLAEQNQGAVTEGDPLLKSTFRSYKKGMNAEQMKEVFLQNISDSLEGMLKDANRHNAKFKKYFTLEPRTTLETTMAWFRRNADRLTPESIARKITKELELAMPMIPREALMGNWVANHSVERQEEILSDPEFLSGEAAYDVKTGQKVQASGPAVNVYTQGKVETYYLRGDTASSKEAAKGIADALNAPLDVPVKNAVLRVISNVGKTVARWKRQNVSGTLPSRALPNKSRDTLQAIRSVGASAAFSPYSIFDGLIDATKLSADELKQVQEMLSKVAKVAQTYTENEVMNMYRYGTIASAANLAKRPEAPTFAEQYELTPAERTLNQLEYQFRLLRYNAKNIGKGGLKDILMTPGDFAENSTRIKTGQNIAQIELYKRLELGEDFQTALGHAYEQGAWAARNATTSFQTKGWLTRKLAAYTPFTYSSFSDLASNIEKFVMDPWGVSSRTAMTTVAYCINMAMLLSNEENRKKYMNLSEYQRTHTIPIDLGMGQLLAIPIDEGFAGFLAPYRNFIQTLAFQEPVTFWKVVGTFLEPLPIDLTGFTEGDRFNWQRGVEKFINNQAPTLVTGALEFATGRDFYYGEDLAVTDRSLAAEGRSADSGGDYTKSYKDSKTLHWLADFLNWPQWKIEQAFSFFTGTVGSYALHYLDKLQGATENETYGKGILQAFYKPFVGNSNNLSQEFYNGIDQLKLEKKDIVAKLNANYNKQKTATGEELIKLQNERQEILDNFAIKVTDYISKYVSAYEMTGGLSKSEASSIYYLFDFTDDFGGGGFNIASAGGQAYKEFENQAGIQAAMYQAQTLGGNYNHRGMYKKADGTWERESPLGTQALNRLMNNRNKEYAAQISKLASDNNLSSGKYAVQQQVSALYDQAEAAGTKPDYDKIEALQAAWDLKAATALAPFFQANGLDMVSSSAVAQELGQYFLVVGDYAKDNKGRFISSSNLNKQRGFVQSFVKTLYQKAGIK